MNFRQQISKYVIGIGFETAYGYFDTLEELANADRPWQIQRTNEQLTAETKEQLFEELKKWKEKIITNSGIDNTL